MVTYADSSRYDCFLVKVLASSCFTKFLYPVVFWFELEKNLPVEEVYLEKGALDKVFREVTTSKTVTDAENA